jgi:hypothetical protein
MPSAGFEPVIPAAKRPQNYALDRAASGIGMNDKIQELKYVIRSSSNNNNKCINMMELRQEIICTVALSNNLVQFFNS